MQLSTKRLLLLLRRQRFIVRLSLEIKKAFHCCDLFLIKMNNLWADQSFEIMERCKAFRFHTPSSLMVVCLSGCSKTVFTTKLLVNNLDSFERPPHQIHYCYGAWQHVFELMKEYGINFNEGIPTLNSCPNGFQRVDY